MNRPVTIVAAALAVIVAACNGSSTHASPPARATAPAPTTTSTTQPATTTTKTTPVPTTLPCGNGPIAAPPASTRRLVLRRRPDAAHPLEILVVGDSIAQTTLPSEAFGFRTYAQHHGFTSKLDSIAFPGFGLLSSRPGIVDGKAGPGFSQFADWQKIFSDAIDKYDPDVVVALWGSWDMVERVIDGRYQHPPDCTWPPYYRALLELAYARLTARGARLAFLAFPCTVQQENPYHHILNATFHAVADAHPGAVAYLDLDRFACPADKVVHSMRAPDGRLVPLRGGDDTHFDFYGAPPVLGPWFAAEATRYLGLPH